VAIGAAAALTRLDVWGAVDAVLYCGDAPPPLPPGFSHCPPSPALAPAPAPALAFVSIFAPPDSTDPLEAHATVAAAAAATADPPSLPLPSLPKPYLHVPMRAVKVARADVANGLPRALAFIREHTQGHRRVLIACGDGVDRCVGVAVAYLVQSAADDNTTATTASATAADDENGRENGSGNGRENGSGDEFECGSGDTLPPPVSKELVRQRLADVSSHHPEARPSRGTLKQVFNYLLTEQQRRWGLRT